jgi:hypothetical protein
MAWHIPKNGKHGQGVAASQHETSKSLPDDDTQQEPIAGLFALQSGTRSSDLQQRKILQMQRLYGNSITRKLVQRQDAANASYTPVGTTSAGAAPTIEEPPDVKKRLDMVEKEYRKMVLQGRLKGYKVAADNMEHFLDGGGATRPIEAKWLRGFSSVMASEQENQQRFQSASHEKSFDNVAPTLADGQTVTLTDYWDSLIDPSEFDKSQWKLYYASGHSTLTSRGEFTLTRQGNTITVTGTVVHSWFDNYDWHSDLVVELPNGEMANDKDALLLEQYRGAAPFKMVSEWTQTVQGTYTIVDFFPDTSSYTWSGP